MLSSNSIDQIIDEHLAKHIDENEVIKKIDDFIEKYTGMIPLLAFFGRPGCEAYYQELDDTFNNYHLTAPALKRGIEHLKKSVDNFNTLQRQDKSPRSAKLYIRAADLLKTFEELLATRRTSHGFGEDDHHRGSGLKSVM